MTVKFGHLSHPDAYEDERHQSFHSSGRATIVSQAEAILALAINLFTPEITHDSDQGDLPSFQMSCSRSSSLRQRSALPLYTATAPLNPRFKNEIDPTSAYSLSLRDPSISLCPHNSMTPPRCQNGERTTPHVSIWLELLPRHRGSSHGFPIGSIGIDIG